jgi:hypothetical protein
MASLVEASFGGSSYVLAVVVISVEVARGRFRFCKAVMERFV